MASLITDPEILEEAKNRITISLVFLNAGILLFPAD